MRTYSGFVSAAALILSGLPLSAADAAPPGDIRDLEGARGSSGESELQSRGYRIGKQNGLTTFWWNDRTRTCARVVTYNGRYDAIDSASASDCGHGGGGGTAAAVIAGVAAVGLIAALASHKKSHDGAVAEDHDREYERGYNDGLYGGHYDRNDSEAYHNGFSAGEAEAGNRRASNRNIVRSAPYAAQRACSRRADEYQNLPSGSSVPVSVTGTGRDSYELVMASGHYRSRCRVTADGTVIDMNPY